MKVPCQHSGSDTESEEDKANSITATPTADTKSTARTKRSKHSPPNTQFVQIPANTQKNQLDKEHPNKTTLLKKRTSSRGSLDPKRRNTGRKLSFTSNYSLQFT